MSRWGDWLLGLVSIAVFADAFDALIYAAMGRDTILVARLPVSRALQVPVVVAAALLLASDWRAALRQVRAVWFVWPPIALAFVSAAWSDEPRTTVLWATALLGTSGVGLALGVRLSARDQPQVISGAVLAIAVASALTAVLWPSFGVTSSGRQWRGLYIHKNLLARVMSLGVVAAAVQVVDSTRRWRGALALAVCAAVLIASHSRAAILSALVTAGVIVLLRIARARRYAVAIVAGGAAFQAVAVLLLVFTPPGLALIRRSETLSDRTRIWRAVGEGALQTPWLGHGYGALWPGPAGRAALARIDLPISHAHNGFLDLYAELGASGLILVVVPLAGCAVLAVRHALDSPDPACLWPAAYLAFFVASNLAESGLLRHKVYWALYVAAVFYIATRTRHRRHATQTGGA